jgi:hypothetical protein
VLVFIHSFGILRFFLLTPATFIVSLLALYNNIYPQVHVCILTYLKSQMPYFFLKSKKQTYLLDNLANVFKDVRAMHNLATGDMPDIDAFRAKLQQHDLSAFPSLDRRELLRLDALISEDIPALMGKVGGVSGVFNMSSMLSAEHTDDIGTAMKDSDAADSAKKNRSRHANFASFYNANKQGLIIFAITFVVFMIAANIFVYITNEDVKMKVNTAISGMLKDVQEMFDTATAAAAGSGEQAAEQPAAATVESTVEPTVVASNINADVGSNEL